MKQKPFIIIANAAVLATIIFLAIRFNSNNGFLVEKESVQKPHNLLANSAQLPIEGKAPTLRGISGWINSRPLGDADVRGKVVLIDFWTYSCINCIRTLPHVGEWHRKYQNNGLVIIGVHAPEFDFEKKKENVEAAVKKYGIAYPVALDSEHETWNAFGNQYWPAHYLIDAEGNIRYHHFGEGHYAETEAAIQQLLLEAHLLTLDVVAENKEPDPDANFQGIATPEIYVGYARINNAGNIDQDTKPDTPHLFSEPKPEMIAENRFYFAGEWTIGSEFSELQKGGGKIILRYKASKINIVAESKSKKEIAAEIFLDGKAKGTARISSPQLYNLVDSGAEYGWHTIEIRIPDSGFRIFTFTFG